MEIYYLFVPILAYFLAGGIKFILNTLRSRRLAFNEIGLGGMPSTHNCITASTFFSLAFGEGLSAPSTAVAFAVSIIVAIDSIDLRQKIGTHAVIINEQFSEVSKTAKKIRTSVGHKPSEVFVSWLLGLAIGMTFFH